VSKLVKREWLSLCHAIAAAVAKKKKQSLGEFLGA